MPTETYHDLDTDPTTGRDPWAGTPPVRGMRVRPTGKGERWTVGVLGDWSGASWEVVLHRAGREPESVLVPHIRRDYQPLPADYPLPDELGSGARVRHRETGVQGTVQQTFLHLANAQVPLVVAVDGRGTQTWAPDQLTVVEPAPYQVKRHRPGRPGAEKADRDREASALPAQPRPKDAEQPKQVEPAPGAIDVRWIPLGQLVESANHRRHFDPDRLQELAQSLKPDETGRPGQVQAITVRPIGQNRYEVVAGFRRYRAAPIAHLPRLKCEIEEMSDERAAELQLAENLQREDPDPISIAAGFQRLINLGKSQREIARRVLGTPSKQSQVSEMLTLLRLPAEVQEHVALGRMGWTVASDLARLIGPSGELPLTWEGFVRRALHGITTRDELRKAIDAELLAMQAAQNRREQRPEPAGTHERPQLTKGAPAPGAEAGAPAAASGPRTPPPAASAAAPMAHPCIPEQLRPSAAPPVRALASGAGTEMVTATGAAPVDKPGLSAADNADESDSDPEVAATVPPAAQLRRVAAQPPQWSGAISLAELQRRLQAWVDQVGPEAMVTGALRVVPADEE